MRPTHRGYLTLALGLLLAACGAPGPEAPQAATVDEPAAAQAVPADDGAGPAEQAALDSAPAPAAPDRAEPAPVAAATPTATPRPDDGRLARQASLLASLPSKGAAPELTNEVWLNSEPLRLADLQGKVVLVEFWTFG